MIDVQWEASQLAALLTTYIAGIEETLKAPMTRALAHAIVMVDEVYDTLNPIVGRALYESDVNLPGEPTDA